MKDNSNSRIRVMGRTKIIIFSIIPLFAFIIITEISISAYLFFFKDMGHPHLGFPFNIIRNYNSVSNPQDYEIPWDFTTNKMRPGKYITKSGIDYVVNSMGFRGKEFDPFTNSGYRIINFGGSSTLGLESTEKNTYPSQLEQMITEKGIRAEVLNFGFCSKSLTFIHELFINEAINYNPNLITIYSNRNTILYDSPKRKEYFVDIIHGRTNNILKQIGYQLYENSLMYRASMKSYLIMKNKFRKYFNNISNNNEHITVNMNGNNLDFQKIYFFDTYPKYINKILSISQKNDIKVALIKQPLYIDPPLQIKIQNLSIEKLWDIMVNKNNIEFQKHPETDSFWILSNAILNKQLDLLASNNQNIILIDPIKEFLGKDIVYEELFIDYVHLSPKGNTLLAKIILNEISYLFENL